MKLLFQIVGVIAILGLAGIAAGLFAMRLHDGPIGLIAGGPFTSGEIYTGEEPDWSMVRDIRTIEFQLLNPARSRTAWIVEYDGKIYIASGYMNTIRGKIWKHWPAEAVRDGRAILRIDGKLYPRKMVRITAGSVLKPVLARISSKYLGTEIPDVEKVPTT